MNDQAPRPMSAAVAVGLGIRFVSELVMFAGLGVAGYRLADGLLAGALLAVVAPAAGIAVWGAWVAPRARNRLPDPARAAVEVALFAGTGAALAVTGTPVAGAVVGVLGVVMTGVERAWLKDTYGPAAQRPEHLTGSGPARGR